ncbi:unnamed protein product [Phytomonas sp. Hart1]|nr:unnamed protein product [Phytomonas sp. Hart1]|eukprot:CCW68623.1 unnamed protein product [Phytomonas sp. isolate Hart1]
MCEKSLQIINNLLIDNVSTPLDFVETCEHVTTICKQTFSWSLCEEVVSPQVIVNNITTAYILVYHLVSHPCSNIPDTIPEHAQIIEGQQIYLVYENMKTMIGQHLIDKVLPKFCLCLTSRDSIIELYVQQWKFFLVCVVNLKAIFSSLLQCYNSMEHTENKLKNTEDTALLKWSDIILTEEVQEYLSHEFLDLATENRYNVNGLKHQNHSLDFVESPETLHFYDANELASPTDAVNSDRRSKVSYVSEVRDALVMLPNPEFYKGIIEDNYISEMCHYYTVESGLMESLGIYEYSIRTLGIIQRETEQAKRYLLSKHVALDKLVDVFVDQHELYFEESPLESWLRDSNETKRKEILSVYKLLSLSENVGVPFIQSLFTQTVTKLIASEVERVAMTTGGDTYGRIIHTFLTITNQLKHLVSDVFFSNVGMIEAMEKGIRQSILQCSESVNFKSLSKRLVSISSDALVRSECETDISLTIEDTVCVYYFLPDSEPSVKEIFLIEYQNYLARRLLFEAYDLSREKAVLNLLAQVQQNQSLFFCRSMVKDIETEAARLKSYAKGGIAVSPIIISGGMWPSSPRIAARLPDSLQGIIQESYQEAIKRHFRSQVNLSMGFSSAILVVNFPHRPPFRLRVSLLQLCIALSFNLKNEWKLSDLCEQIGCSEADCSFALGPFIKKTILQSIYPLETISVIRVGTFKKVGFSKYFNLIPDTFREPLILLSNCNMNTTTHTKLQLGSHAIESRIVQLLKNKGPQPFDQLLQDLNTIFHPSQVSVFEFKKRLENILARGFIERDQDKCFKLIP